MEIPASITPAAYCVDIVMCIDASGGMTPFIEAFKEKCFDLFYGIVKQVERRDKYFEQFRVKLILFRDFAYDNDPITETPFFHLPEDTEEFLRFVQTIHAAGGGDCPENALEAIALALKSDWTTVGRRRRHMVFVFTDAPAHPLQEKACSPSYPSGMPKDLAELGTWWEGTDPTFVSSYRPQAGRMIVFAPPCRPWTDMEAWGRCWTVFMRDASELSDNCFQFITDLFSGGF